MNSSNKIIASLCITASFGTLQTGYLQASYMSQPALVTSQAVTAVTQSIADANLTQTRISGEPYQVIAKADQAAPIIVKANAATNCIPFLSSDAQAQCENANACGGRFKVAGRARHATIACGSGDNALVCLCNP